MWKLVRNVLVIITTLLWNTCYKHSHYYPTLVCVPIPIYTLFRYIFNILKNICYSCVVTSRPSKVISFLIRWVGLGLWLVIILSHFIKSGHPILADVNDQIKLLMKLTSIHTTYAKYVSTMSKSWSTLCTAI